MIPKEIICMKSHPLFFFKNKNDVIHCFSTEFAHRVLKANE